MKSELVGRSTFAELLFNERLHLAPDSLAELFGFRLEENVAEIAQAEHDESDSAKIDEQEPVPNIDIPQVLLPPNSRRHRPVEFWQPLELKLRDNAVGSLVEKDRPPSQTGSLLGEFSIPLTRRPFTPLAKIPDIRVRLRQQPAMLRPMVEPDIEKLASSISCGHLPLQIPYLKKRSWGQAVHVIQDVSERLCPYHCDMGILCHWLAMYGAADQTFSIFNGVYGDVPRNWPFISSPREKYGQRMPDVAGATVLAITDLGGLERINDEAGEAWAKIGEILAAGNNRLIALVPCRADTVPIKPKTWWQVVQWERPEFEDSHPPTEVETSKAVERLLAFLSMADCIEPQLVRRVRRMLPEGRRDSGLESRVWTHPSVRSDNPDGAVILQSDRERFIEIRNQEPEELQRRVFEEIQRMHLDEFAGLLHTEILNLGPQAERYVSPDVLRNAQEWFERLSESSANDASLRRFFRIAAPQLTRSAMERYQVLHELWDRICGSLSGATPPKGFDPRRIFNNGDIKSWTLTQTISGVAISMDCASARKDNASQKQSDFRIAEIRTRKKYLSLAATEIGSVNAKESTGQIRSFFRNHDAPVWMDTWGIDRFGKYCEFSVKGARQRMRWIQPGKFLMGSPTDEEGRFEEEGPQHEVTLRSGFWMFDTPCTQELWTVVMGNNPSHFTGKRRPVEKVSWDDCQQFITSLVGLLPGLDLKLPTEAQWEYACRGGTVTSTYDGPLSISGEVHKAQLWSVAWYDHNSDGRTHDVGENPPNPIGLFDMLGNVWEWCVDGQRRYTKQPVNDPVGKAPASYVIRGGAWGSEARGVRSAYRYSYHPSLRHNALGFRCVGLGYPPPEWIPTRDTKPLHGYHETAVSTGDEDRASSDEWVNLKDDGRTTIVLPIAPRIRIRTDLEDLYLRKIVRPDWASEMGRDEFGLWGEFSIKSVCQRLRWIPPGRFWMGSPLSEVGRYPDEGPAVEIVHLEGFWMFDTPCTQELWAVVMETTPPHFDLRRNPVEKISWNDSLKFIERINARLHDLTLTLPSESQWEYACRAGTQTPIWNSTTQLEDVKHNEMLREIAWFDGSDSRRMPDVAKLNANPWGLFDMLGLVWEWCRDNWRPKHDSVETSLHRVVRGGGLKSPARSLRAAFRRSDPPAARNSNLGFRCCSSGPEPIRIGVVQADQRL